MMFAKDFEYYTIILRGAVFSWTRCTSKRRHNENALPVSVAAASTFLCTTEYKCVMSCAVRTGPFHFRLNVMQGDEK